MSTMSANWCPIWRTWVATTASSARSAAHYPAVGEALLATLRHFSGDAWTDELQENWATAYGVVAGAMSGAAEKVAESEPPWWDADVIEVDLRTFDIAVLKVRTETVHPYVAGQSVSVEPTTLRPREWRFYTPANAPGGLEIELHARLIDGGPVSTALVRSASAGDKLRLGPPFGRMTLDRQSRRESAADRRQHRIGAAEGDHRPVGRDGGRPTHLYFGARSVREIYDRKDLEALADRYPWLTVVIVISDDIRWKGPRGWSGTVAAAAGDWSQHDVFVCGSPAMVESTVKELVASRGT